MGRASYLAGRPTAVVPGEPICELPEMTLLVSSALTDNGTRTGTARPRLPRADFSPAEDRRLSNGSQPLMALPRPLGASLISQERIVYNLINHVVYSLRGHAPVECGGARDRRGRPAQREGAAAPYAWRRKHPRREQPSGR